MAKKSTSLKKKVQQAIAAIETGQFSAAVLDEPEVIAKLSKDQQLSVWRAKRIEWLGDKGWKSVDDLYRKERLATEFSGYKFTPSNSLKKHKGSAPKKALQEADALGGEVRWHTEWSCPCIAFKFPIAFAGTPFSRWAVKAYGKKSEKGNRQRKEETAEIRAMKELVESLSVAAQEVLWEAYHLCDLELGDCPIQLHRYRPYPTLAESWLVSIEDWAEYIANESGLNKAVWVAYGEEELIEKGLMEPWDKPYPINECVFVDFSELDRLTDLGYEVAEYLAD